MRAILPITFAVIGAFISTAWAGQVSLHGSTTVMNAIIVPSKAAIEEQSGQQLDIVGNGSQRGIADLVAGRAQIAMISAPLAEEIRQLNEKTPGAIGATHLKAYKIGESRVAFAIHPANTIRALTRGQLSDLFIGKDKNWRELGGATQKIGIFARKPGGGLRAGGEAELLKGADLT